ncbi:MAG: cupin domain-containing protein [Bacillota bacterium]|nr:cupin domain-containing protein [Bacillota bacterium]
MMNLFHIPELPVNQEKSDLLIEDHGVVIERIISTGQSSPEGFWYEQERDEWVALLQGEAVISRDKGKMIKMKPGDWILIPAFEKHRVEMTSSEPPCIWLAVHGKLT